MNNFMTYCFGAQVADTVTCYCARIIFGFIDSAIPTPTPNTLQVIAGNVKWWHVLTLTDVLALVGCLVVRRFTKKTWMAAVTGFLFWRLVVYFVFCTIIGFLWSHLHPGEEIVASATALSILLALGAIDIGWAHRQGLLRVEGLIRSSFGLEDYVQKASEMYKSAGVDRVVTSLRHWVARGEPASWIEKGVMGSSAKELVFVGTIKWDVYYPGVLWRFMKLREILRKRRQKSGDQPPT